MTPAMPVFDLAAHQLVELLAAMSACDDEPSAITAAVECAASAVEAEVSAFVSRGRVVGCVGFAAGTVPEADLLAIRPGRPTVRTWPKIGECSVVAAQVGESDTGILLLGRAGVCFSAKERHLVEGMARVLGLTLSMLRALDAERRRERLIRLLYQIQRSIARRVPLQQVLRMTVDGGHQVIGCGRDLVELWLFCHGGTHLMRRVAAAGPGIDPDQPQVCLPVASLGIVGRVATAGIVGLVTMAGQGEVVPGGMGVAVTEDGKVAGCLYTTRVDTTPYSQTEQENLLTLAEHVSLALTDARNLREMNHVMHDGLTGLASRGLFLRQVRDRLAAVDSEGEGLTLLFIDLDRFKLVNDQFGHSAGDTVLTEVAKRLRSVVDQDAPLARIGGDEFAVLLAGSGRRHATKVAERVVRALGLPVEVPQGLAQIGASVGIAMCSSADQGWLDLLQCADQAMYQAKQAGGDRYAVFCPQMTERLDDTVIEQGARRLLDLVPPRR